MADPYDWLGLPKGHRPPTHYQLLGVPPKEATPLTIRMAAEHQLRRLTGYRNGPDATSCEILAREIEQARDTLLDPERRELYDLITPDAPVLKIVIEAPKPAPVPKPTPAATSTPAAWWQDAAPVTTPAVPPTGIPVGIPAPPPTAPAPKKVVASDTWWQAGAGPEKPAIPTPAVRTSKPLSDPSGLSDPTMIGRPGVIESRGPNWALIGGVITFLGMVGGLIAVLVLKKDDSKEIVKETKSELTKPKDSDTRKVEEKDKPETHSTDVEISGPASKEFLQSVVAKSFKGHAGAVMGVAVSPNGKHIASVDSEKGIRVWSLQRDGVLARNFLIGPGIGIGFLPTDGRIAVVDGFSVHLAEALKDGPRKKFDSPRSGNAAMAIHPDGRILVGLSDGAMRWWTPSTGKSDEWTVAGDGRVTAVAISDDGSKAYVAIGKACAVYDVKSGQRLHGWAPHNGGVTALAVSPNGQRIFTAGDDGTASIFDLPTKKAVATIKGHAGPILSAAWLKNGLWLVTAGADEKARLWEAETGRFLRWTQNLEGKGFVTTIAPGDSFAVVGTGRGIVQLLPLPRVALEAATPAATPPKEKPSPPALAEIAQAAEAIRTELKTEYARTTPEDRALLGDKLYRRGIGENRGPAARYALLIEARDLATKASAFEDAMRAVDGLDAWFDVDDLRLRTEAAAQLLPGTDLREAIPGVFKLMDRAEREARNELLERLIKSAPFVDLAALTKEQGSRLAAIVNRLQLLEDDRKAAILAQDALKQNPKDPAANTTLGTYLCLLMRNWDAGLPFLKLSGEVAFAEAAKKDTAPPKEGKEQIAVAEAWFKIEFRGQRRSRQSLSLRPVQVLARPGSEGKAGNGRHHPREGPDLRCRNTLGRLR